MNLVYTIGQTKVTANEDGTISVPMLAGYSGAPKKWREISPFVWQDTNGGDRLAADVVDGRVVRFSAEPIASILVWHRWFRGKRSLNASGPVLNRRASALIGRVVPLDRAIVNGRGRVQIADAFWDVEGPDLPAGTPVRVMSAEGMTLRVDAA